MPATRSAVLRTVLTVLLPLLCGIGALTSVRPPAAAPADAPATAFSAERAYEHLERIARHPRPTGGAYTAEVRDYLVATLGGTGLTAEVQRATVFEEERPGDVTGARVENVVARLEGTGDGPAVLLAAHYDSVGNSPGANDDGVAVAALLEAARAIKAAGPTRNDVVVLFTDAEESGSLGARAFVERHRWASDVGVALNFEARGRSGPSIMFESSGAPAGVLNETGTPVASSVSEAVYGLLGHYTDFTVFEKAGIPAMNFAYVGELMHYHTPIDSLEHVDRQSLQHHGEYATDIGAHLASSDLAPSTADEVHFTLPLIGVVSYPLWGTYLLAGLALALLGTGIVMGVRRGALAPRRLAGALPLVLGGTVLGGLVPFALWQALRAFYPGYDDIPNGDVYNSGLYLTAFALLTACALTLWLRWCRKKVSAEDLAAAAAVWWAVLMGVAVLLLPEAAYVFVLPLLAVGPALAFPAFRGIGYAVAAAVGLLLLVPACYLALLVTGLEFAWAVFVLAVALLVLLLSPVSFPFSPPRTLVRWATPLAPVAAVALLAASLITGGFDEDHPEPGTFFYLLDSDTGRAQWGTTDAAPEEWTDAYAPKPVESGRLPKFFRNSYPFRTGEAPAGELPGPEIKVVRNVVADGVRTVRFTVGSRRMPPVLNVTNPSGLRVRSAVVNGTKVTGGKGAPGNGKGSPWTLEFLAVPREGLDITLVVLSDEPFPLRVHDRSFSIEEVPSLADEVDRPEDTMPGNDHGDFVMTSTETVVN
ncbi:M20/M25/M40 family metallo-hydrolase [Streptomyces sp. or20]|uniref:M20/M25/M40 family metallo-hydrolase n=1 Tax=Streptomyces sp. or20 TaxID=1828016 RepID=UPI000BF1C400|nr:M20/M25/M40 family metallo-hydrolase [Streptomyces sp. or20]